ncbi:class I SAM-dependent methyltransferase [Larkinella rosea]|uniref:Class I SAM-dependent methyltransferase n=1 Tax=Larkinella rosea TaxID=2025312 RepID=A0A3P1BIT1_9BACT|nr:class I SAM-dependent methyltransferase [Larkinella rosea]RRB00882.1 class I SAM-dependent methyltransferase [Larkinella rosea]
MNAKQQVHDFWNEASCGEDLYLKGETLRQKYYQQAKDRYVLEPYIREFADFPSYTNRQVLEIGVGLGADHQKFAEARANLHGCDLTERAIDHTRERLALFSLRSDLRVADAENLPYETGTFDLVYSWGVIHHSPDTPRVANEIFRVLKPGGRANVMIYHKHSWVGYLLWLRYGLAKGKPNTSLATIYANYLESPGTKAYSKVEAKQLFASFSQVSIQTVLTHADLLSSQAGQRHRSWLLTVSRWLYPRWLIRLFFPEHGLYMMISAIK